MKKFKVTITFEAPTVRSATHYFRTHVGKSCLVYEIGKVKKEMKRL